MKIGQGKPAFKFVSDFGFRISNLPPHGGAPAQMLVGLGITALLVLITVPTVEHRRHELRRGACIESLSLIAAAKEALAAEAALPEGTPVTMEDLLANGEVIQREPVFPPGTSATIGVIGELPQCVYRGETLNPLIDYFKIKQQHRGAV